MYVCPSVRPSPRPSVPTSVRPHVRPSLLAVRTFSLHKGHTALWHYCATPPAVAVWRRISLYFFCCSLFSTVSSQPLQEFLFSMLLLLASLLEKTLRQKRVRVCDVMVKRCKLMECWLFANTAQPSYGCVCVGGDDVCVLGGSFPSPAFIA